MAAHVSNNSILKAGNGASPEVFEEVAQVEEIKPPTWSKKIVDIYVLGQSYPIRKLTTDDPQTVELKLLFDPAVASHEAFRTSLNSSTARNYQIILPDPGAYQVSFNAYVVKFEIDSLSGEGAAITANVTLELTAAATVTP